VTTKEDEMAPIVRSVEVDRRPDDVFAYLTDASHWSEWQVSVIAASPQGEGPLAVGSTATVTRRVGPRRLRSTEQVVELTPPRRWTSRGVSGPIVATAASTIEPLDGGERSRVTIALDFQARGIARLLVPLVIRPQARRQLPRNEQLLKRMLEHSS
jgi:uncharacterized protein YndB with AHSA1/START domain